MTIVAGRRYRRPRVRSLERPGHYQQGAEGWRLDPILYPARQQVPTQLQGILSSQHNMAPEQSRNSHNQGEKQEHGRQVTIHQKKEVYNVESGDWGRKQTSLGHRWRSSGLGSLQRQPAVAVNTHGSVQLSSRNDHMQHHNNNYHTRQETRQRQIDQEHGISLRRKDAEQQNYSSREGFQNALQADQSTERDIKNRWSVSILVTVVAVSLLVMILQFWYCRCC